METAFNLAGQVQRAPEQAAPKREDCTREMFGETGDDRVATRVLNDKIEQFDRLTGFRFDRADFWRIILECEREAERAIDTTRAAGWFRLALEIKDAERAANPRTLAQATPLPSEMAD